MVHGVRSDLPADLAKSGELRPSEWAQLFGSDATPGASPSAYESALSVSMKWVGTKTVAGNPASSSIG